jgi:MFS family permease
MTVEDRRLINTFFIVVIGITLGFHFFFDLRFKTDLVRTGDDRLPAAEKPFYGIMHVPGTSPPATRDEGVQIPPIWIRLNMFDPDRRPAMQGALGADFSQVYYSAKALHHGESEYAPKSPEFQDRFGRKPNYPPYTNRLYMPLSSLPYYQAVIIHNFLSLGVFLGLAILMLKIVNLQNYIWKSLVFFLLLYFYTPLGFAHFERGQFDLWVASSYLLLFSCFFLRRRYVMPAVAAGLFGALKWSSAPFIGTVSLMAFLGSNWKKSWIFLVPGLVMVLTAIIFLPEVKEYWPSLQRYEFDARPFGISFMYFMPRVAAKGLQIISCGLVIVLTLLLHRGDEGRLAAFKAISFPFALTMFIQGMCYGTISFEYRIVSIFGLLPAYLLWMEKGGIQSTPVKAAMTAFFALFLLVSFRIGYFLIWDLPTLSSPAMSASYLASSAVTLIFTCYISIISRVKPSSAEMVEM